MEPLQPRRNASEETNNPSKRIKSEDPAQFSAAVKKKLQSSSRTGQACDRCKIRKIRCDALPGGCSPCLQTNTTCQTTDRTTGQTRVRGAEERLEEENRELRDRIQQLTDQLGRQQLQPSRGNTGSQLSGYHDGLGYGYSQPSVSAQATPSSWGGNNLGQQLHESVAFRTSPSFRTGGLGDTFVGVSTGNSNLSSIKGTVLSIFGMEIDIADFQSTDMDEPQKSNFHSRLYNKSYQSFIQTALNINERIEKPDLPNRREGLSYAEWYFRTLNPYSPLLHKPTFMKLLTNMYDDPTFRPTFAQLVIVHMVFAIMFFHFSARNRADKPTKDSLIIQSNAHYHYSLSFFYQMTSSHTVEDVQALTLICLHLRNFPKPGASWMLTQTTMSLAIELGLHRSVKRWVTDVAPSLLEVQMRQRIFWTLLAVHVTLSGKLNRPMPYKLEDFDVELPEPVDDDLLSENGLDLSRPGKCAHKIGLLSYSMVLLFLEMYTTIYAVRAKPEEYIPAVNRLEAKLRDWKESLPAETIHGDSGENENEGRVFALYAQLWALEFRLLLRHPSKTATNDTKFNAESMRICVESSQQMLRAVQEVQKYKSLDTTWYQVAVYIMAITVTLHDKLEKRNKVTLAEFATLQEDMNSWLNVLGEVGELIGAGSSIREKVQSVTDSQLGLLSHSLPSKRSYSLEASKPLRQQPVQVAYTSQPVYPSSQPEHSNQYVPNPVQSLQQTPYPAATQYSSYPEAVPAQNLAYTPSATYPTYSTTQNESGEAPLVGAYQGAHHGLPQTSPTNAYHQSASIPANLAWQQYASNMGGVPEPQDCYSASALMQLQGGRGEVSGEGVHQGGLTGHLNGQVPEELSGQWPMIVFPSLQQ